MASDGNQLPTCPVCKQSDQVKTMEAAFESGVTRAAPPDMPTRNVSMMKYILSGGVAIGICIFLIIVLVGSEANVNIVIQAVLVGLTFICIVTTLVISYMAFQRVVKGDAEATVEFPAWDRAMNLWKSLDYCSRDNLVFNPATNEVLSEEKLALLRTLDQKQAAVESAPIAR
ncbi:MAG TPA: hypothetical protein VGT82_13995 [Ktedonobacteraceae bacterium]|nr:hypothetical protein [Ktedonobacteraceae bacterium]